MIEKETLFIDPEKVESYRTLIEDKFQKWYQEEWSLVLNYPEFLEISYASFLAYLKYPLDIVTEDGRISVKLLEEYSRAITGEYFSDSKFSKACRFIEDNEWDRL